MTVGFAFNLLLCLAVLFLAAPGMRTITAHAIAFAVALVAVVLLIVGRF